MNNHDLVLEKKKKESKNPRLSSGIFKRVRHSWNDYESTFAKLAKLNRNLTTAWTNEH